MNSARLLLDIALPVVFGAISWFANLPTSMQWLIAAWVFSLGACFGSFMNVVIYRVPACLSVVYPGSRCPKCLHAIRGFDNLPVLSWLILRGRCRDCGTPISIRYPAVEAIVAFVVLGVVTVDVFMGTGGNETWLMAACHVLFLCTLICAALIEFDGHAPPLRLFYPALIASGAGVLAWPSLNPGPLPEAEKTLFLFSIFEAVAASVLGAGLGLLLLPMAHRASSVHLCRRSLPMALALCGLVMGTLAVCGIAIKIALILIIVLILRSRKSVLERIPVLGYVLGLALIQVARFQTYIPQDVRAIESAHAPSPEPAVLAALVLLVVASAITSFLSRLTHTAVAEHSATKDSAS